MSVVMESGVEGHARNELAKVLEESACDAGSCYANGTTTGLHLMRWQEDMANAASLLRKQHEELEKCGGLAEWHKLMKTLASYEQDYQRLTAETRKQRERIAELERQTEGWKAKCEKMEEQ
jgi:hypothetical protein